MKNKHLIVVSVDALVYEDLEYAKNLPMFKKLISEGAMIERVQSIYPSLTHPAHASIMTGCSAGKTGIVSNELFLPGEKNRPWYNYLSQVKCDTIFHAAHRAGLTTAACCWPVTAGDEGVIDYLIAPPMNCDMQGSEDNPLEVYRKLGSRENVNDIVESGLKKFGCGLSHPIVDEFLIYCGAEVIKKHKPNLLLTHPSYVDSARHRTGLFSDLVKEAIEKTDEWLGILWEAVCEAGIEEETDFVVLSDHGHLNFCRIAHPNVLLADAGFIRLDENGELKSWDAYVMHCDLSAQVYLSRPDDKKLWEEVYCFFTNLAKDKVYGFERVFTREDVKSMYGLDGDFSFVLETDGYTAFGEDWNRPLIREMKIKDYHTGYSRHGHMPEKGPQPTFIAMGPSIEKGVVIPRGNILDHAPTFAKILGIQLPDAEGKAVDLIIRK